MEKIEHRAVIKFLTKQGKSAQIIFQELLAVYGDSVPEKTMVYKWHGLFKQGRESIEDDPRSGRPIEATTSEIVEKVEKLVLEDTRWKKKQLAAMIGVSETSILNILHDHLGMTKLLLVAVLGLSSAKPSVVYHEPHVSVASVLPVASAVHLSSPIAYSSYVAPVSYSTYEIDSYPSYYWRR
ncbi:protein GVQW3-like [Plodia interpunctella]|uniref:protein GVQW3-like n=1 Tax=Plodia interpunctella TaxID=58824 RepID=UPI002368B34C|nr:protein GVQW3-like [Plodia interpunctella]